MLAQPPSSWPWTVVACVTASTSLSRVVASGSFASLPRQLARSLHPFRLGISIECDGPIRPLLLRPTFAFLPRPLPPSELASPYGRVGGSPCVISLNRSGAYRVPRSRGTLGVGNLPLHRRDSGPVDALSTLGAPSPATVLAGPYSATYGPLLITMFSHGSSLSLSLSQLSLAQFPTVVAGRVGRLPQLRTVNYSSARASLIFFSDGCMGASPQDGSGGLLTSSL